MPNLVFGCGYLGSRVASRWRDAGDDVYVVTRSHERAEQLARGGFAPIVADVTRPESLADLPPAEIVLYAVGFDRGAGQAMRSVHVDGLRAVLDRLSEETLKFIYTSSTGVYGQSQGEWIDEDSETTPDREGGRVVLEAEQLLAAHPLGQRAVVLRLAGLYGPGRIPRADDLRQVRPIAEPHEGYLNLIHVEDAASVVVAAAARAAAPRLYIVSDGQPVLRRDYYEELARQLGAPAPRFAPPDPASAASARATSSKRASNRRMLAELAVVLKYPNYREGLAGIIAESRAPEASA